MSIICGIPLLECVYCLACARWAWKRCLHTAGHDSENWGIATAEEFEPVPRMCCYILAVYEDDLRHPLWEPPEGYGINPDWLEHKKSYEDTDGQAPPYILYLDHDHEDIVLAFRGLNLAKESDYAVLLDNKLGQRKFDGGYVHNGLLKAAEHVLLMESDTLKKLVMKYPNYTLTFAGHSLGSGVATLLAVLAVQNRAELGNIDRRRIRCYAIAPARCMSLNLAVRYADVINSVVLQATTPLEDIFKSLFCLPCILCLRCMRDTCIPEEKMIKDPRRLYAPGRLYHIVERKPFRMGRFPPEVRTAVPVDGRFEHIVLSCNATSDHAIVWIEREARRALELMLKKDPIMEIPTKQRMERQETLAKEKKEEYKAALQRAVTLSVPHAFTPSQYGTFDEEAESSPGSAGESSFGSPRFLHFSSHSSVINNHNNGFSSLNLASSNFSPLFFFPNCRFYWLSSRKELRDEEFKQEMVIQFPSSVHSNRIDPSRVVQLSWRPRVFLYEGFLSDEECDHLISSTSREEDASGNTIKKKLMKSSETPQLIKDDVVSRIEERISAWTFLPKENGKDLQIFRYENEDSEKNFDYFGNSSLLDQSKPLIATVVLYLSDAKNGGQIIFPKSKVKGNIWSDCTKSSGSSDIMKPKKGNAILFFNIYPNSTTDTSSSHARCPVLEGEMWFAIKFFQVKITAEEKLPSSELSSYDDCTDEDDNCSTWAAMGECKKNAVFMIGSLDYYGTCRKSCNAC
ncbi:hypothetical protein F8388_017773 [Cannabis sativa]|uniref:procollagen-proline 4-dioxygenase n=1 Tax=Cannabis sativa TaxID=3483 RepID=A0A7J6E5B7_CANSA|nr:hypothetical protein F8388_017773 [Cannabis sativa]